MISNKHLTISFNQVKCNLLAGGVLSGPSPLAHTYINCNTPLFSSIASFISVSFMLFLFDHTILCDNNTRSTSFLSQNVACFDYFFSNKGNAVQPLKLAKPLVFTVFFRFFGSRPGFVAWRFFMSFGPDLGTVPG